MKKYSTCTALDQVQFQGMTEQQKIMLFHQSAAQAMKKRVTVIHFTTKIIHTYLYTTCNMKILFVKKYFSLL